jgi:hypothetical protein
MQRKEIYNRRSFIMKYSILTAVALAAILSAGATLARNDDDRETVEVFEGEGESKLEGGGSPEYTADQ